MCTNSPKKTCVSIVTTLNVQFSPRIQGKFSHFEFFHSIPAIPSPSEVACVCVTLSDDLDQSIKASIASEGRVLERAPVQIAEVVEKPGGLLVHWSEVRNILLRIDKRS